MKVLPLLLATTLTALPDGSKWLSRIEWYQQESYYKEQAYREQDAKSFAALPEPNRMVNPEQFDFHLANACVFYATNELRESKGKPTLKFSGTMRDAATVHTYEMISRNFFDHYNRSNRKLYSPENRISLFEKNYAEIAENCDYTYMLPEKPFTYLELGREIVSHLNTSTPHRKTMLSKSLTHMGCAAMFEAKQRKGAWYVKTTQNFIRY